MARVNEPKAIWLDGLVLEEISLQILLLKHLLDFRTLVCPLFCELFGFY